jgi:hypothetical protein
MLMGASKAGFVVVDWSSMAFAFNWFRARNADDLVPRLARGATAATSSSSTTATRRIGARIGAMRSRRSID